MTKTRGWLAQSLSGTEQIYTDPSDVTRATWTVRNSSVFVRYKLSAYVHGL
jgi:hypothetical protein